MPRKDRKHLKVKQPEDAAEEMSRLPSQVHLKIILKYRGAYT